MIIKIIQIMYLEQELEQGTNKMIRNNVKKIL